MDSYMQKEEIGQLSANDLNELFKLSFGRVLRMLDRPFKQGDIEEFERCRNIIMDVGEALDILEIKQFLYSKSLHQHHKISSSILFGDA